MGRPPGRRDYFSLTGFASGAAHDPGLREQGYGAVLRDFYQRALVAYAEGRVESLPTLGEMSHLVSVANRQYHAEQELGRAINLYRETGFDQAITGRMMARDFDAGPQAGYGVPAQQRIRFQMTTLIDGQPFTRWATYEPLIEGPSSVASLLDMVEQAGRALADSYGEDFEGLAEGLGITVA